MQILFDEKGTVQRISVVKSSGIPEIDNAAVGVFRRVTSFPNPPLGMIDEDGFVRIDQGFIVTFTDSGIHFQFSEGPSGLGPRNVP